MLLEPVSVEIGAAAVTVFSRAPGAGHTALSLVMSGRMRPDAGQVLLEGRNDPRALRSAVALVDVPDVSEPDGALPLHAVVGEELAMSGRPSGRARVSEYLAEQGLQRWSSVRVEDLDPDVRVGLLATLAASRPGARAVVICCPDRYGASGAASLGVARDLARNGTGVLLQLTHTTVATVAEEPELRTWRQS